MARVLKRLRLLYDCAYNILRQSFRSRTCVISGNDKGKLSPPILNQNLV